MLEAENCRLSIDHCLLAPNRSPIHKPDLFIDRAGGLRYDGGNKKGESAVKIVGLIWLEEIVEKCDDKERRSHAR